MRYVSAQVPRVLIRCFTLRATTHTCVDRFKTLLWLGDRHDSAENLRIRRAIPGHHSDEVSSSSEDMRVLAADNKGINLEDQIDVILFTSVAAVTAYLSHADQAKLAKYPPSMFRIICNRRMSDSLLLFLDSGSNVSGISPAILVNHDDGGLSLTQPKLRRPNLIDSDQFSVCQAFASFKPVPMHYLQ